MRDVQGSELPVGVISERRRADRVRVEIGCQAVTEEDFALLGETIVDLSGSGCLLRAEGICADVGERLIVSFKPPHSSIWIDAEATIVRLLNGKDPRAPAFALSLEGLNGFEQEVLKGAIKRVRRPDPQTRRRRQRIERLRGRRSYTDPDAVAAQPLVSVRDHVTTLPRATVKPAVKRARERPLPAAILGKIDLVKKAAPASAESPLPRSLWRSESAPSPKESVVVVRRGYKRPLPRTRLQSTEQQVPLAQPEEKAAIEPAASMETTSAPVEAPAPAETAPPVEASETTCAPEAPPESASAGAADAPSVSVCRPQQIVVVADRPAGAPVEPVTPGVHRERVVVVR